MLGGTRVATNWEGSSSPFTSPWDTVTQDAKDVVMALLQADPADRASPDQALAMPWFFQQLGPNYATAAVTASAASPGAAVMSTANVAEEGQAPGNLDPTGFPGPFASRGDYQAEEKPALNYSPVAVASSRNPHDQKPSGGCVVS